MSKETKEQPNGVEIKLVYEVSKIVKVDKGKKEVVDDIDKEGQPRYSQNDVVGLQGLLGKFDSRLHPTKEWKLWTAIKEKLYDCYLYDKKALKLSREEASFLKDYLDEFPSKEGKNFAIQEFEARTLESILEQLE